MRLPLAGLDSLELAVPDHGVGSQGVQEESAQLPAVDLGSAHLAGRDLMLEANLALLVEKLEGLTFGSRDPAELRFEAGFLNCELASSLVKIEAAALHPRLFGRVALENADIHAAQLKEACECQTSRTSANYSHSFSREQVAVRRISIIEHGPPLSCSGQAVQLCTARRPVVESV